MQLTFASYNIHKAVGLDGRRNPDRILKVLHEIAADIVAVQEVDRRFGRRESVLPRQLLEEHGWCPAPCRTRADSIGWHGNAILVRRGIEIVGAEPIELPKLEPRGAVCAHLRVEGRPLHVVGMHLDLSGIRRQHQIQAVRAHMSGRNGPAVLLGDFNEWSPRALLRRVRGWLDGARARPQLSQPPADRATRSDRPLARVDVRRCAGAPQRARSDRFRSPPCDGPSHARCPIIRQLLNRQAAGSRTRGCRHR